MPEDRHAHGIFLELPGAQTISASNSGAPRPTVLVGEARRRCRRAIRATPRHQAVEPGATGADTVGRQPAESRPRQSACRLPRIIILDEPTRGIDAQARQDVYRLIRDLTAQGVGVLVISSELGEVIDLSDRILVMYRGRVAEVPGSQAAIDQVSAAVFGMAGEAA